ncbi:glycosyltransferase N-terminal domain-containing protein [Flaviaesturariibacter terrae]
MLFYNLIILLYGFLLRLAALFVPKAKAWRAGRRQWATRLEAQCAEGRWIWMHCASAGEFEQGKPLLEALRKQYPGHRLLLSFFSPSGYEVGVKYKGVDAVTYLPLDTAANARRFVSIVKPELVVFIKYDYWYQHLKAIADRKTPLLLVSAIFRPQQAFFRPWGAVYRRLLHFFTWLFVQDDESVALLETIGVRHCSANGDTRFDRVANITNNPAPLPLVEEFVKGAAGVLVAGSTWKEDEDLLSGVMGLDLRFIIAPHEIGAYNVARIRGLFPAESVTYSELERKGERPPDARVLIIDNFGMLSRLYRYATITYIGGGFNKSGIHNTLEAAAWGKPVFFGPNYQKFREAKGLIACGAGQSVQDPDKLAYLVDSLLGHPNACLAAGAAAAQYVRDNLGATGRIMAFIQEKRLLTS